MREGETERDREIVREFKSSVGCVLNNNELVKNVRIQL